jgi:hypothetical protein
MPLNNYLLVFSNTIDARGSTIPRLPALTPGQRTEDGPQPVSYRGTAGLLTFDLTPQGVTSVSFAKLLEPAG